MWCPWVWGRSRHCYRLTSLPLPTVQTSNQSTSLKGEDDSLKTLNPPLSNFGEVHHICLTSRAVVSNYCSEHCIHDFWASTSRNTATDNDRRLKLALRLLFTGDFRLFYYIVINQKLRKCDALRTKIWQRRSWDRHPRNDAKSASPLLKGKSFPPTLVEPAIIMLTF